jgi:hypothetical protein
MLRPQNKHKWALHPDYTVDFEETWRRTQTIIRKNQLLGRRSSWTFEGDVKPKQTLENSSEEGDH